MSDQDRSTPKARGLSVMLGWLPAGRTLSDEAWWHRHRAILILLWLHVAAIPPFAVSQGRGWGHGLIEALMVALPALAASTGRLRRGPRTWASALGLLTSSAVLVHLSGGLIEMHFHFFVMVAVVALYQDWVPFLLAIGYVLVHHGLIGALDPTAVFNHPSALAHPWRWAAVHALFIAGISLVCLVTWRLNETALALRTRAEEENARLYEAERTAHAAAETARQRLGILAEASRLMSSSLEVDVILQHAARLPVPGVADACAVDLLEDDGSIRRAASVTGEDPDGLTAIRYLAPLDPSDERSPLVRVLRTGTPIRLEDVPGSLLGRGTVDPEHRPVSAIVVPLQGRRDVLGTLTFLSTTRSARRLAHDEQSLAEELARRAASAIENARLYARERSVAETLQRSLLPQHLPRIPGIATAVRYEPAGEGGEVGGDWYDSFVLPGGNVAIAMGDVVGRGIKAAALMGQLRNATRAHAMDGLSPTEVVAKLSRLMHGAGMHEALATLIFGVLDAAAGTVRMVNAGHPPPLILRSDGSAELGAEGLAVPLGTVPNARFEETVCTLEPGDTLILYTDGLVEDRETSLDEGLGRLQHAAEAGPANLEALCDHIMATAIGDRRVADDTALIAMRMLPVTERLAIELPNDPMMLAPLRAVLRRWLAAMGASDREAFDIIVAVGEACTNAIEHAHGPASATFELEASAEGGIRISVRDHGTWRPARKGDGGRGLSLMEELMDEVRVDRRPTGTEVSLFRALEKEPVAH